MKALNKVRRAKEKYDRFMEWKRLKKNKKMEQEMERMQHELDYLDTKEQYLLQKQRIKELSKNSGFGGIIQKAAKGYNDVRNAYIKERKRRGG